MLDKYTLIKSFQANLFNFNLNSIQLYQKLRQLNLFFFMRLGYEKNCINFII